MNTPKTYETYKPFRTRVKAFHDGAWLQDHIDWKDLAGDELLKVRYILYKQTGEIDGIPKYDIGKVREISMEAKNYAIMTEDLILGNIDFMAVLFEQPYQIEFWKDNDIHKRHTVTVGQIIYEYNQTDISKQVPFEKGVLGFMETKYGAFEKLTKDDWTTMYNEMLKQL